MTELSISHAARNAAERSAIETASQSLTFATCAAAIAASPPTPGSSRSAAASPASGLASSPTAVAPDAVAGAPVPDLAPIVIVATPSIETVLAVYAAFEARRPIALLPPGLAGGEPDRQRALVERTPLPPDTAAVLFTSGSTGAARGVALSRAALVAAADASARH